METGDLAENDIAELVEICKSAHGLAEPQKITPLAADHIPGTAEKSGKVTLVSIFHYRGVNALAENQTLRFSPDLTVVYGDNRQERPATLGFSRAHVARGARKAFWAMSYPAYLQPPRLSPSNTRLELRQKFGSGLARHRTTSSLASVSSTRSPPLSTSVRRPM